MTRIDLLEGGEPKEVPLPSDVGLALAESRMVRARPVVGGGTWLVGPSKLVGAIHIAGVEIYVRPKIEIQRLVYLLGYVINPRGWKDSEIPLEAADDLVTAVAYAFVRQAESAFQPGLLQGYKPTEAALPVVRGRIRESEQLRRHHGRSIPLEVRYDEYVVDIPENQILLAATDRLLLLQRVHKKVRRQLRHIRTRLSDVSTPSRGRARPTWSPTRLNVRYHDVLRLAELLLDERSFEHGHGGYRVSGFMVNMWSVYQDFVCVALAEALRSFGGKVVRQFSGFLDESGEINIKPDLVWYVDRRPQAVVDAKYKAEKPSGFPYADLYQVFAYCTSLGLRRGHLIYAEGGKARHLIRNAGIEIVCHSLDLQQPIRGLLGQLRELAEELRDGS